MSTNLARLVSTAQKSIPIDKGKRKQLRISSKIFTKSSFPNLTVIVILNGCGLPVRLYWFLINFK